MKSDTLWLLFGGVALYLWSRSGASGANSSNTPGCYPTNFIGPIPNGSYYCDELLTTETNYSPSSSGIMCLNPDGSSYTIPMGPCPSSPVPAAGAVPPPISMSPTLSPEFIGH